jgi:hypothetical protein
MSFNSLPPPNSTGGKILPGSLVFVSSSFFFFAISGQRNRVGSDCDYEHLPENLLSNTYELLSLLLYSLMKYRLLLQTLRTLLPNSNNTQHNKQGRPVRRCDLYTRRTAQDCLVPTLRISSIYRRRINDLETFDADGYGITLTLGVALTCPTNPWLQGPWQRPKSCVTISVRVNCQLQGCTLARLEFFTAALGGLIVLVIP